MIEIKYSGTSEKGSHGLYTRTSFKKGDLIHTLKGYLFTDRLRETVEVIHGGAVLHLWDSLFQFCNHSFTSNVVIDKHTGEVTALHDISPNEELTFDYTLHESEIAAPFIDYTTQQIVGKI